MPLPRKIKDEVLGKSRGRCWYCGVSLCAHVYGKGESNGDAFSVDHLVPTNAGGTSIPDNLIPCCQSCNSRKGQRHIEEFRQIMGRRAVGCPESIPEGLVEYLKDNEIELPVVPRYMFWAETEGLLTP